MEPSIDMIACGLGLFWVFAGIAALLLALAILVWAVSKQPLVEKEPINADLAAAAKRALPVLDDGEADAARKAEAAGTSEYREKWLHVAACYKADAAAIRDAIAQAEGGLS